MANDDFDVVVIGGGMAGISGAALLAKRGVEVLVVEKNTEPEGHLLWG